jgi:hypothetical protein
LEIPVGDTVSPAEIKKLMGQVVPVLTAGRTIIAVGKPTRPGCYSILCYVPRPDFKSEIDEATRLSAIDKLVASGKLTPTLGQQLRQQTGSLQAIG